MSLADSKPPHDDKTASLSAALRPLAHIILDKGMSRAILFVDPKVAESPLSIQVRHTRGSIYPLDPIPPARVLVFFM